MKKVLGDEERGRFAAKVGLPKNTLANYELGLNEPPFLYSSNIKNFLALIFVG